MYFSTSTLRQGEELVSFIFSFFLESHHLSIMSSSRIAVCYILFTVGESLVWYYRMNSASISVPPMGMAVAPPLNGAEVALFRDC